MTAYAGGADGGIDGAKFDLQLTHSDCSPHAGCSTVTLNRKVTLVTQAFADRGTLSRIGRVSQSAGVRKERTSKHRPHYIVIRCHLFFLVELTTITFGFSTTKPARRKASVNATI
jgi:hypothetical protein